jgi:preprotein translocase subunit SecA
MAGRGVDIKLAGSPEGMAQAELRKLGLSPNDESYEEELNALVEQFESQIQAQADEVRELGGLFIVGTERHESRRIDNQLRGRSGRQGDPGESRFFLSAEDDLIRLFAGDRIYKILDRLGPVNEEGEEEALEAKMLTRTIENAQKKVEEQNFLIRKRVLEYDDVMNEQRRVVYKYRREILEGKDMSDSAREGVGEVVSSLVDDYTPGDVMEDWDLAELQTQVQQLWPSTVDVTAIPIENVDREDLREQLLADALATYDRREQDFGDEIMRQLERAILLQIIDNRWREHLYEMDYLREGIHLRGFAQIDPLVAYKNEGFTMFEALMHSIWEEFARLIFHVEVEVAPRAQEQFAPPVQAGGFDYSGGTAEQPSALGQAALATAAGPDAAAEQDMERSPQPGNGAPVEQETVVKDDKDKIGRNDPCWCGSGKKYKKCHGA